MLLSSMVLEYVFEGDFQTGVPFCEHTVAKGVWNTNELLIKKYE